MSIRPASTWRAPTPNALNALADRDRAGKRFAAREDGRARRFRHRGQGAAGRRGRLDAQNADGRGRRPGCRGRHPVGAGGEFLFRFPRRPESCASGSRPIPRPARSGRCASASTSRTTATSPPSRSPTPGLCRRAGAGARRPSSPSAEDGGGGPGRRAADAARRALGHRPHARHDGRRDQEPRPHLLLRRGLPDAAFARTTAWR